MKEGSPGSENPYEVTTSVVSTDDSLQQATDPAKNGWMFFAVAIFVAVFWFRRGVNQLSWVNDLETGHAQAQAQVDSYLTLGICVVGWLLAMSSSLFGAPDWPNRRKPALACFSAAVLLLIPFFLAS